MTPHDLEQSFLVFEDTLNQFQEQIEKDFDPDLIERQQLNKLDLTHAEINEMKLILKAKVKKQEIQLRSQSDIFNCQMLALVACAVIAFIINLAFEKWF